MKKDKMYRDYCTGCGLCKSFLGVEFEIEKDGFTKPIFEQEGVLEFCENVCPASGKHVLKQDDTTWGKYIHVYKGFSANQEVRYKASSGGMITSIAMYLLQEKMVDGIVQIGENDSNPFLTESFVSTSVEEIMERCGSRYVLSSTLENIIQVFLRGGKYAVIGRPCEIIALKNFLELNPQYNSQVYCTISFFCAGSPSVNASIKLAKELGVEMNDVKRIRYRGFGWPGRATVYDKNGSEASMNYIDSWMNILGRDIRKICKFCTDGVGEFADISCGDLWKTKDCKPIFDETDGENIIFTRSEIGENILNGAYKMKYIEISDYEMDISDLTYIQPNHANRKRILYPKMLGLKLTGQMIPQYNMLGLKKYSKNLSFFSKSRITIGTIRRVLQGRI